MDAMSFRVPVRLRVEGALVEIETLREAVAFLDEWPVGRRGPVFTCAQKGCEAALTGAMKLDHARAAFESFARITGILVRRQYPADPVRTPKPTLPTAMKPPFPTALHR